MVFQFQCPQGHVLTGNESDVGQMSQCPTCGEAFLIPGPMVQPQPDFVEPTVQDHVAVEEEIPASPEVQISVEGSDEPPISDAIDHEPELLHIDCPQGHQLEVPRDMLNQDALCPHCNVQFRLREVDSEEYQRKKKVEEETRERRMANAWLNWTIALGIMVVLFFLALWALTVLGGKTTGETSSREGFPARHSCHRHPLHLHLDDWRHRTGKGLPLETDGLPSQPRDA